MSSDKVCESKLNIAMIGQKRIPSREGGVEIVVEELSSRMVKNGHRVICYNRKGHHVSGEEFDLNYNQQSYKGVQIIPVFTINKKGLAAMSSSFFAAIKSAFSKCDIVHFHAEGPCVMLCIPHLAGKKTIATIHGLDWARSKWGGFASKYIKFGEKIAVKYADEIIVLSKNVQKYFKDTYNRETIYLPNGTIKPNYVQAKEITEKFGLTKNSYFLYLGRIVPEKGVKYLIEAFKKTITDKKLVIAGGASDTDEFVNEIKRIAADDDRIIFTGFVQGNLLDELFSNAYVYSLPSDLEGMPLSLIEAMSYGNCCLVSNIAECTEVVENNAIIFKKGNIEDLQKKLQNLSDDTAIVDKYKVLAINADCIKNSWDDIADKTLEVYFRIING